MVEFTPAILAHLFVSGYKGLKVRNNGKDVLVEPIMDIDSIEEMSGNNAYTISITDHRALEMIRKVLLLNMNFYIDQKFIQ